VVWARVRHVRSVTRSWALFAVAIAKSGLAHAVAEQALKRWSIVSIQAGRACCVLLLLVLLAVAIFHRTSAPFILPSFPAGAALLVRHGAA